MSLARLRSGEWLAAGGAIVLLVALFVLHWYGASIRAGWWSYPPLSGSGAGFSRHHQLIALPERTGWTALPTLRWFALVSAALGIALAAAQAATRGPALPVTLDLVGMLVAGLTTILLLIALATTGAPLRFGAIVGVIAVAAVTFGAFRAMRAEQGFTPGPGHPVELVSLPTPARGSDLH